MPASLRSDFIHIVGITIHIAGIARRPTLSGNLRLLAGKRPKGRSEPNSGRYPEISVAISAGLRAVLAPSAATRTFFIFALEPVDQPLTTVSWATPRRDESLVDRFIPQEATKPSRADLDAFR